MDAMLERIDVAALPASVCWVWPDRDPEPALDPDWLRRWAFGHAVYAVA
jgi:hypothetical protein